jgi:hypothetical protein
MFRIYPVTLAAGSMDPASHSTRKSAGANGTSHALEWVNREGNGEPLAAKPD